jgi:hypothetical protein
MAVAEMKESGWHPPPFKAILILPYALQISATMKKI